MAATLTHGPFPNPNANRSCVHQLKSSANYKENLQAIEDYQAMPLIYNIGNILEDLLTRWLMEVQKY